MTAYRTAGERPEQEQEEAPKPARMPVCVVTVVRYGAAWMLLLVVLVVGSFCGGVAISGSIAVRCARSAPGAVAQCDVRERDGFTSTTSSFALREGTLKTKTIMRSDDDEVILDVPNNLPGRSYGASWTTAAAQGADSFRLESDRMTWSTEASSLGGAAMGFGIGLLFLAFTLFIPLRTVVRLDGHTREITIATRALLGGGQPLTRSLDGVEKASVESIDDSDFMSLCLVLDDKPSRIATGGDRSCNEAARAINAFLAELREARALAADSALYFADWNKMDDTTQRARAEAFLESVGVARGALVRTEKKRIVELSGDKAGLPVVLRVDVSAQRDVDIRVTVTNPGGRIVLVREKGAGRRTDRGARRTYYADDVFVANRDEAEKLDAMPDHLRERIIRTLVDEEVSLFAIRADSIEVHARQTGPTRDDPVGHVSRLLDVVTEVAVHVGASGSFA
jgi:hypothetical protein